MCPSCFQVWVFWGLRSFTSFTHGTYYSQESSWAIASWPWAANHSWPCGQRVVLVEWFWLSRSSLWHRPGSISMTSTLTAHSEQDWKSRQWFWAGFVRPCDTSSQGVRPGHLQNCTVSWRWKLKVLLYFDLFCFFAVSIQMSHARRKFMKQVIRWSCLWLLTWG